VHSSKHKETTHLLILRALFRVRAKPEHISSCFQQLAWAEHPPELVTRNVNGAQWRKWKAHLPEPLPEPWTCLLDLLPPCPGRFPHCRRQKTFRYLHRCSRGGVSMKTQTKRYQEYSRYSWTRALSTHRPLRQLSEHHVGRPSCDVNKRRFGMSSKHGTHRLSIVR